MINVDYQSGFLGVFGLVDVDPGIYIWTLGVVIHVYLPATCKRLLATFLGISTAGSVQGAS